MSDVQLEQVYLEMYEKPPAAGLSKNQLQLDCQNATAKLEEAEEKLAAMTAAKNRAVKWLKRAVDTISSNMSGMYVIGASDRDIAEYKAMIQKLEKV